MYFEAEKFAGIAHYNPARQIKGYNGNPRYISLRILYVPSDGWSYYKRFHRLPLMNHPLGSDFAEIWVNAPGQIEKQIEYDSIWDNNLRRQVEIEKYRYEAFFDEDEKCIHCEITHRSRKENKERQYLYDFEYTKEGPFRQRNIVCKDLQRNRAERYSYHYDMNGDLEVFDKRDDCRMRFTYDGEHRLLAKEEYEKNRQTSLFDGPLIFNKGTYYEYDRQGKLVSVFKKDQQGELSERKQVSYFEDGTSRTIEKDFLGKAEYTWYNSEGKPVRNTFTKRPDYQKTVVVHDDILFNTHGDIISIKRRNAEYRFSTRKNEWVVKRSGFEKTYEYVYDHEGNWIQREALVDGQTRFVTQRVIEYW